MTKTTDFWFKLDTTVNQEIIINGEVVFRPFDDHTYTMLQDHSTYNGVKYKSKDYAFNKRAEHVCKFRKYEWYYMVRFFNHRCCKCESEVIGGIPTKDHIYGIRQGGSNSIRNIQPLCRECNTSKGKEVVDYRVEYCRRNNLDMPKEWRLHA